MRYLLRSWVNLTEEPSFVRFRMDEMWTTGPAEVENLSVHSMGFIEVVPGENLLSRVVFVRRFGGSLFRGHGFSLDCQLALSMTP